MAAGMWQGIADGLADVRERKEAREAKEEEILRRRRSVAAALRPKIDAQKEQVSAFRAGYSYLQGRGLSETTLNALSQDPTAFNQAMDFASTTGADMQPEKLNEIFRATVVDGQTPQNAQEYFKVLEDTLSAFDEVEDPEVFVANLPALTPTRNTVIESRMPVKPLAPSEQDTLWKNQAALFDQRVTEIANNKVQELKDRQESEAGISEQEQAILNSVGSDLDNFNSSDAAKARIRGQFGTPALQSFEDLADSFTLGLQDNPYLQIRFGQAAPQEAPQITHTPPEGGVLAGSGVDPNDGVMTYFYRMPDGSTQQVKE